MMRRAPRDTTDASFGGLLRHWRSTRGLSQLGLAAEADISGRHLCFLETGRAHPSREMVLLLAGALDLALIDQNAMLVAAGFAPAYRKHDIEAPELAHVRQALDFILKQHEPYPAVVVDGGWNTIMRNEAAGRILQLFLEAGSLDAAAAGNAMHMICHPRGLRRFIENWKEFAGPLVQMIHREAAGGTNIKAARLRDELLSYPGMPARWSVADANAPVTPVLTMRLKRGDLSLSFFSTLTTLATPRDIGLAELRVECFYPADTVTADAARSLAAAEAV